LIAAGDYSPAAPFEYNIEITFDFIGQGPGNSVMIKEKVHLPGNANGSTTVSFEKLTQECKQATHYNFDSTFLRI